MSCVSSLQRASTVGQVRVKSDELSLLTAAWKTGSPFRGLNVFDFEQEAIYFGRIRAVRKVADRLKRQAVGHAFLLVLGPSVSGKSSLIRAGVMPLLSQPRVISGVGLCRRVVFRPEDSTGDLFDGLAAALLKESAIPGFAADGTTATKLATMLREQRGSVPLLIKGTLSQAAAAIKPSPLRSVVTFVQGSERYLNS
jgi:hypothetical protein